MKIFGFEIGFFGKKEQPRNVSYDTLPPKLAGSIGYNADFDGDKFAGGFGETKLFTADYWTLRERSSQLFTENLYARGIIRRLLTNEIGPGLSLECSPDESILRLPEDSLTDWCDTVENRFGLWGKTPQACDHLGRSTLGAIMKQARIEALVGGDVLVVLHQSNVTKLPTIQLIRGDKVQSPLGGFVDLSNGNDIKHGVEINKKGVHIAYHAIQDSGESIRIPAFGARSGRRVAWLVYGTDKRLNAVRGEPLLSLMLQSLKEIDRYRDSTQRKAVVNSILAMFIKKNSDKPGSLPITGGASRRGQATTTDADGSKRTFKIAEQIPGMVIEELQEGEEPILKGGEGTDINFGTFEEAVITAIAWANEIPPEILRLSFSNNYSASQAAINEFKIYLNKFWIEFGETFCTPIYTEWLLSEVLQQKIQAPTLLDAWRDKSQYDVFAAWVSVEWYGSIKPSTDLVKQTKGSKNLVNDGWSTNARESRALTGTKFSKNIKKLKIENQLKVDAARPLAEFNKEFGEEAAQQALVESEMMAMVEDMIEARVDEN